MKKEAVVILAAGIGSRMNEITDVTSKCIVDLNNVTPIEHTLKSFSDNSVKNAIIVVGHYADKIQSTIEKVVEDKNIDMNLTFVRNNLYNYHGCEYSLSCAAKEFHKYNSVYVTEGDLLLGKEYVSDIVKDNHNSSILIRSKDYIDPTRSVVAVSNSAIFINKFVYDINHRNVYDLISKDETVIGESVQLWKFSRGSLKLLTSRLLEYHDMANESATQVTHSGLYSINKIIKDDPMYPIKIDGKHWLNLNTVQDVIKAKSLKWLNR